MVPLAALVAAQSIVCMGAQVVPVLAPEIARGIGVDAADIGVFTSVMFVAAVISSVTSGSVVRRFGALRVCQTALVITGLGLALAGSGAVGILLSAVALGLGYGPPNPAGSHVLMRITPAHLRSLVFSVKQVGVPIGSALTGVLAPLLLEPLGLIGTIMAFAAVCIAAALLLQPLRRDMDADRDRSAAVSWRDAIGPLRLVLRQPAIRHLALVSASFAAMQTSLSTFFVAYMTEWVGLSLTVGGLAASTAWLVGIVGRIAWGIAADRWGQPRRVLAVVGILMSLGAVVVTQFTAGWPLPAIYLVSAAFGATAAAWNGVYLAEVARLAPPGRSGEATGGVFLFTFGGVVVAPLIFRLLVQATGNWTTGFWALAVVTLLASATLLRPVGRRA